MISYNVIGNEESDKDGVQRFRDFSNGRTKRNNYRSGKSIKLCTIEYNSRIINLEVELNTPLFNRHNRGMSLTPEGKKLLVYCEKILTLTNEMKKVVKMGNPSGN